MVPRSRLDACHAYNCQLQRRHQEICAQYENLRVQNQDLANKNLDLADKLAAQEELLARHQQRQSEWDQERSRFEGAYASLLDQSRSSPLPRDVSTQLEDLARRYQGIVDFDPATGISKFRSDVLFDSGLAELKPDYTSALADFAAIMNSSSARDLRIMIVGHTDERPIVRDSTRQAHPTNWHLSANRAIAVEQYLEQSGRISPNRMGAVGYGPYQPVASGRSPDALAKNRRVEIFVLSPDAPIVGRTNGASY
jgi:chemotaxis protein MotB